MFYSDGVRDKTGTNIHNIQKKKTFKDEHKLTQDQRGSTQHPSLLINLLADRLSEVTHPPWVKWTNIKLEKVHDL